MATRVVNPLQRLSDPSVLYPGDAREIRTRGVDGRPVDAFMFPPGVQTYGYYTFPIPADWVSGMQLRLHWMAISPVNTATVTWVVRVACIASDSTEEILTKPYAAETTAVSTLSASNASALRLIGISPGATDSPAAGKLLCVRIGRDPTNISFANSAYLVNCQFAYSDT